MLFVIKQISAPASHASCQQTQAFERAAQGGLGANDCGALSSRGRGFDEVVLDGLVVHVTSIELAVALRPAERDPAGGAVAGAPEARRFAERFQQNWTNALALLPVVGELSVEAGEQAPLIPSPSEGIGNAQGG